ncbi:TraR/DksA C4-type zinc finger protein [Candidatus Sumerlaeota bacterium]|nr:TraR/DksA C4-type zinc finger protein [Candidatus Sumerlaeota bacterium]
MSEQTMTEKEWLDIAFKFHGHQCPAMPLGVRIGLELMRRLGVNRSPDSQLVALTEIGNAHFSGCFADGIMVATGCTFGKDNIKRLCWGKFAVTLIDRNTGRAIRAVWRADAIGRAMQTEFFKMRSSGTPASEVPPEIKSPLMKAALESPLDELFEISDVFTSDYKHPDACFRAFVCEECGEMVAETYGRIRNGKKVCIPCATKK